MWASQPVWTFCRTDKSLATTGIPNPDHPACSLIEGDIKTKTQQKDSLASALYQPSGGTKITEKQYNILETQSVSVLKQTGGEATTHRAYMQVLYSALGHQRHSTL
jgi:hypothetical protein